MPVRLRAFLLAFVLACPGAQAADPLKIGGERGTIDFAIGDSKLFRATGTFTNWQGMLKVDQAEVRRSAVEVVVKTRSVQMQDNQQTAILKDSEFFDVERFPEMIFRSTRVERTGENTLKVDGDITLRGITRPMTLNLTVSERRADAPAGSAYAQFHGFGTIKRSEFGMTRFVDVVGDTVEISITAEAWR